MPPPASILFPTRRRRDYLAVALASVAPQARAAGAEIVVVEDDPPDAQTRALCEAHGARYVAHGQPRGINVARNTAIQAAGGELLCLLDDDVAVWDGWLDALLGAAAALPEHEAFCGPIRPRLEGARLHPCGREPLPVTALDLGPEDRDADLGWGANLALRRGALARIGPFDPALGGAGDEEDWQLRLRAAGGRVRYVARAGVDHRRAGADATLARLSRAAYHRGRHARRWDARRGATVPAAAELRTLLGCLGHTVRYRCGVGIALSAHSAGRLRETLAPAPSPPSALAPDYLSGRSGTLGRRDLLSGRVRDALADARAAPARRRVRLAARSAPPRRRVRALTVARPEHAAASARARWELERSRHAVAIEAVPPAPGAGKWENLNAALRAAPGAGADWLLLLDDDVTLPRGFLDAFLLCAERFEFRLAQPAHAFASHAAWEVTRRRPGAIARRTRFVEIGPVTAIHADAFTTLLPFPELRMGWGLDAHWAALVAAQGWPAGIVDLTPIHHTRPVASDYPREDAIAEAEAYLATRPYVPRAQANETLEVYTRM